MIRVTLCEPPSNYDKDVKIPGENFLKNTPSPTNTDWGNHNYWKTIHDYLYTSHKGICFYSASWTPRRPSKKHLDRTSVDHYIPKSSNPKKAYDWYNFRLCRSRLNHRKANHLDVLDPCAIENGWFNLDFSTFLLKPSSSLSQAIKAKVLKTIQRLELNHQDYVHERIAVIKYYCLSKTPLENITLKYPFIAQQIKEQDFDNKHMPQLRNYFKGQ